MVYFFFSCSHQATNPEELALDENQIYQVPGCAGQRGDLFAAADSCFSYYFDDAGLLIDFCVRANCCPDINRFGLSYQIDQDTITVAVADTAERQCRCVCTYVIHADSFDLPLEHYVFVCYYYDEMVYLEDIWR